MTRVIPDYNEPVHHRATNSLGRSVYPARQKLKENPIWVEWLTGPKADEIYSGEPQEKHTEEFTYDEFKTAIEAANDSIRSVGIELNGYGIEDKSGYGHLIQTFGEWNKKLKPQPGADVYIPRQQPRSVELGEKVEKCLRGLFWMDFTGQLIGDEVPESRGVETLAFYQRLRPILSEVEVQSVLAAGGFKFSTDAVRFAAVKESCSEAEQKQILNAYGLLGKVCHLAAERHNHTDMEFIEPPKEYVKPKIVEESGDWIVEISLSVQHSIRKDVKAVLDSNGVPFTEVDKGFGNRTIMVESVEPQSIKTEF